MEKLRWYALVETRKWLKLLLWKRNDVKPGNITVKGDGQ